MVSGVPLGSNVGEGARVDPSLLALASRLLPVGEEYLQARATCLMNLGVLTSRLPPVGEEYLQARATDLILT